MQALLLCSAEHSLLLVQQRGMSCHLSFACLLVFTRLPSTPYWRLFSMIRPGLGAPLSRALEEALYKFYDLLIDWYEWRSFAMRNYHYLICVWCVILQKTVIQSKWSEIKLKLKYKIFIQDLYGAYSGDKYFDGSLLWAVYCGSTLSCTWMLHF